MLALQIEAEAHRRHGKALTNFGSTLPAVQSDLARDLLKDPYSFDFLTLADNAQEKHLQAGLLEHLRELLIELGVGFAFNPGQPCRAPDLPETTSLNGCHPRPVNGYFLTTPLEATGRLPANEPGIPPVPVKSIAVSRQEGKFLLHAVFSRV